MSCFTKDDFIDEAVEYIKEHPRASTSVVYDFIRCKKGVQGRKRQHIPYYRCFSSKLAQDPRVRNINFKTNHVAAQWVVVK